MQTSLRKMGNSTGMIIPKAMLDELGLASGAKVDLRVVDGEVVVRPARNKVRQGWAEAAKVIGAENLSGDDLGWLEAGDAIDGEWTW